MNHFFLFGGDGEVIFLLICVPNTYIYIYIYTNTRRAQDSSLKIVWLVGLHSHTGCDLGPSWTEVNALGCLTA